MKFLAKINRGFAVSVVVLLAVTIYLVTLSISHTNALPDIKKVSEGFIKQTTSYKMLPEKYRTEKPGISKAELESYISDMSNSIKSLYIDNEQSYKYIIEGFKKDLEKQADGKGVVYKYNKEIIDYDKISFNGNTVVVEIQVNYDFDGPDYTVRGDNSITRVKFSNRMTDTITLQKSGGKWKVINVYLPIPIKQDESTTRVTKTVVGKMVKEGA